MAVSQKTDSVAAPADPASTASSRAMIELGIGSIDSAAVMARRNVEMMLATARAAVHNFEAMSSDLASFSRDSADRTTSAMKAMTAATSPKDLLMLQAEYAREQLAAATAQTTKMSQAMFAAMRDSFAAPAKQ